MLETLSLDAGGVLVRPNWPRIAGIYEAHGVGVAPEALLAVEFQIMRELDSASLVQEMSDADRFRLFLLRTLQSAGASGSQQAYDTAIDQVIKIHAADNLWEYVPADVAPALQRFKAHGLKLVVLSNANGTVRKKLDRLQLSQWFSHVVDSGEENVEKPDPRFFELALQRAQARRNSTLHVGDLYHVDVIGARRAGIHAVLIDRGVLQKDRDCTSFPDLAALAAAIEQGFFEHLGQLGSPLQPASLGACGL